MVVRGVVMRPLRRREGEQATRTLELLEAPHDLRLLRGEPFGRKRGVGLVNRDGAHIIEPTGQIHEPGHTNLAGVQVRGARAALPGVHERPIRKMPTTKQKVSERHG